MKICCICKEKALPTQPVYPFPQLLKELGIDGNLAHPACIRNEQQVRADYKRKFGVEMTPPNRRL